MKLIWPGVLLGTGAVGTAGGLYGNSLYLKSVSRQEADVKFEKIKSEIKKFVKDFGNNEEENISTILVGLLITLLNSEKKDKNFEELKTQIGAQSKNNLDTDKEKKLEDLYKKMEDFIKFLKDSGIGREYQNKIASVFLLSEEETLSHN